MSILKHIPFTGTSIAGSEKFVQQTGDEARQTVKEVGNETRQTLQKAAETPQIQPLLKSASDACASVATAYPLGVIASTAAPLAAPVIKSVLPPGELVAQRKVANETQRVREGVGRIGHTLETCARADQQWKKELRQERVRSAMPACALSMLMDYVQRYPNDR